MPKLSSHVLLLATSLVFAPSTAQANDEAWKTRPYLSPNLVFSAIDSSAGSRLFAGIGGQGGFIMTQQDKTIPLTVRTRASGTWFVTSGGGGGDLRVGSFVGPNATLFSAEIGVDLFRNQFSSEDWTLPRSIGIDLPINIVVGPELVQVVAGATPALLFNNSRRVDWSATDEFGFGDEFEWHVGGQIGLPIFGFGLTYTRRVMAPDLVSHGVGFGISLK